MPTHELKQHQASALVPTRSKIRTPISHNAVLAPLLDLEPVPRLQPNSVTPSYQS